MRTIMAKSMVMLGGLPFSYSALNLPILVLVTACLPLLIWRGTSACLHTIKPKYPSAPISQYPKV